MNVSKRREFEPTVIMIADAGNEDKPETHCSPDTGSSAESNKVGQERRVIHG